MSVRCPCLSAGVSVDAYLSQRDRLDGGCKGPRAEVPVAFTEAVVNDLDIALWDNKWAEWDELRGEWLAEEGEEPQARVESLRLALSKPGIVDGELAFKVLSVTGALAAALGPAAGALAAASVGRAAPLKR